MEKLPFIAWVLIGLVVVIIIVLNFGLWAAWKHGHQGRGNYGNTGIHMHLNPDFLRNPWIREDEKWKKLNNSIQLLDKKVSDSFETTENHI